MVPTPAIARDLERRGFGNVRVWTRGVDPGLFRTAEEFRADVAGLCNVLRATPPLDPARPVMVAGDPERTAAARRMQDGIPTGRNLLAEVRTIAEESGVPWLLAGDPVAGTAG